MWLQIYYSCSCLSARVGSGGLRGWVGKAEGPGRGSACWTSCVISDLVRILAFLMAECGKTSSSTANGSKLPRFGTTIFAATENTHCEGVDVAGMHRIHQAHLDISGNLFGWPSTMTGILYVQQQGADWSSPAFQIEGSLQALVYSP